ncbi:hypothetical protein HDU96_003802 [Phlyctochytrium bullatum]|nr:hypothetical protein HDU96_003802 [Phlyctochytrium bullatum]
MLACWQLRSDAGAGIAVDPPATADTPDLAPLLSNSAPPPIPNSTVSAADAAPCPELGATIAISVAAPVVAATLTNDVAVAAPANALVQLVSDGAFPVVVLAADADAAKTAVVATHRRGTALSFTAR